AYATILKALHDSL
ncbi:hypothetical protein AVEN_127446-1, partial [Araneus ventricosus]